MSKALAFSRSTAQRAQAHQAEMLSSVVVLACAAALILAGQPLPV